MKNTKKIMIMVAMVMLAVNVASMASAFGVASLYWKENPLMMSAGEVKDVDFVMQNMVGNSDFEVKVDLVEGAGIATLTDFTSTYKVRAGTSDTTANLRVALPSDAVPGTEYSIKLIFTSVSGAEGGAVNLGMQFEKTFKVIVTEAAQQPAPAITSNQLIIGAIAVVIVALILWMVLGKKRKRR